MYDGVNVFAGTLLALRRPVHLICSEVDSLRGV